MLPALVAAVSAPDGAISRYRSMHAPVRKRRKNMSMYWRILLLPLVLLLRPSSGTIPDKRSTSDHSVNGYLTERICWWNEVCKEEFQSLFRCKCPEWSFCRAPGRYYNAFCSMTATGYIWTQPDLLEA